MRRSLAYWGQQRLVWLELSEETRWVGGGQIMQGPGGSCFADVILDTVGNR